MPMCLLRRRPRKKPERHQASGLSEGDERIRTADGGFADPWLNHLPTSPESGRRDSNPRRPAWEAGILPLNYSRNCPTHSYSTETPMACQASLAAGPDPASLELRRLLARQSE